MKEDLDLRHLKTFFFVRPPKTKMHRSGTQYGASMSFRKCVKSNLSRRKAVGIVRSNRDHDAPTTSINGDNNIVDFTKYSNVCCRFIYQKLETHRNVWHQLQDTAPVRFDYERLISSA
jgi:hypothetical protein